MCNSNNLGLLILTDARAMYDAALERLEAGDIRDAAEKAVVVLLSVPSDAPPRVIGRIENGGGVYERVESQHRFKEIAVGARPYAADGPVLESECSLRSTFLPQIPSRLYSRLSCVVWPYQFGIGEMFPAFAAIITIWSAVSSGREF